MIWLIVELVSLLFLVGSLWYKCDQVAELEAVVDSKELEVKYLYSSREDLYEENLELKIELKDKEKICQHRLKNKCKKKKKCLERTVVSSKNSPIILWGTK